MDERQQQKLFADLGIGETDATRIARFLRGYHAPRVVFGKFGIGKRKQRSKRLIGQSNQLERHVPHLI
jgi:hypothetical protein